MDIASEWDGAKRALLGGDASRMVALVASSAFAEASDAIKLESTLLLAEAFELEAARASCASITDRDVRARAEDALRLDDVAEGADAATAPEEEAEEEVVRPVRGPDASAAMADAFLEWFGGRRDLYSTQWYDEARRRHGYRPVEQPLTRAVAQRHLEGRMTLGQYLLFPDGSVSFAVIDLDLDPSALAEHRATRGEAASCIEQPALRRYALALVAAARSLGVPLFAEDSGGRGLHLWCFFRPRRPARAARTLLQQIVAGAGPQPPEVRVELFPKQERPGPRGLSSLVKLPLGVHQVTLRRCALLDDALRPIDDVRHALARIVACPDAVVDAVVGRRVVAFPAPELEPSEPLPPLPSSPTPITLAERLRAIAPGEEEREASRVVLDRCDVLRAVVARAYERRALSPDEARAIAYTIGLFGREPATAREAFVAGRASFKELDRLQRGVPSPMGCARLRKLSPESGCNGCPRDVQPYPTPVLHAIGTVAPKPRPHAAFSGVLEDVTIENPVATLAETLRRIEARLDRIEGRASGPAGGDHPRDREP